MGPNRTRLDQSFLFIHFTTEWKKESHLELLNYSQSDKHHHFKQNRMSLWKGNTRKRERERASDQDLWIFPFSSDADSRRENEVC